MSNVFRKSLGELLMESGKIDKKSIEEAIKVQNKSGKKLGKILQEKGLLDEATLYSFLQEQLGINFKMSIPKEPTNDLFNVLPIKYCRSKQVAPVEVTPKIIKVFISDPTNTVLMNEISFMTGRVVDVDFATEAAIGEYLEKAGAGGGSGSSMPSSMSSSSAPNAQPKAQKTGGEDKKDDASKDDSPVVRFVEETLQRAIQQRASDIHFEVYEKRGILRFRTDGELRRMDDIDIAMYPAVISRIKIMAELDISEKRLPQDGRIMTHFEGRQIDLRVSIIPSVHGECAVLRILDKGKSVLTLKDVGLSDDLQELLRKEAQKPYGMILVTGPTGSGKTTTLYALLQYVLQFEHKILTVEDPVEYQVEGINQVQVHSEIGLTFAAGLRAFLRHDPDIIMVGEIRDKETAEIAIRAALTGHLVLSTVHTNDAASSISRFIDMGIPPYMLTSTINLVIAQRLVRKICTKCKTEIILDREAIKLFQIEKDFKPGDKVYRGTGCQACGKSGYSGRQPVFEMMKITDNLKTAVLKQISSFELKDLAQTEGMMSIRNSGILLVKEGVTTLEEIEKIVTLGD